MEADLHPALHLTMLGADGPGKHETTPEVIRRCTLFCDDWVQASHGGEISGAVEEGRVTKADVTNLGAVLAGDHRGRTSDGEMTLFDSTGLAIQDLAIARAAREAWQAGAVDAQTVTL
jgi:ornithine cyclodeaminase/alanine dehydrogenase-like protein (mu-crystallin family)